MAATKKVPVYFYYVNMTVSKLRDDLLTPHSQEAVEFLEGAIKELLSLNIRDRKIDYRGEKRVVWIDSVNFNSDYEKSNPKKISKWCADIVMKSAKYDQVRKVINTDTMEEDNDKVKTAKDGDEENTHFCLEYFHNRDALLCIEEFNYYGIRIGKLVSYINDWVENYRKQQHVPYAYSFQSEIMPCNAFIEELKNMRNITVVTLGVPRKSLPNQFMSFADRGDVGDVADIVLKPAKETKKQRKYIHNSTVKAYFDDMQSNSGITRIRAIGKNQSGPFTLDTELMKTKQSISVQVTQATHEVKDDSFFAQAKVLLERMKQDENYMSDDVGTDS